MTVDYAIGNYRPQFETNWTSDYNSAFGSLKCALVNLQLIHTDKDTFFKPSLIGCKFTYSGNYLSWEYTGNYTEKLR